MCERLSVITGATGHIGYTLLKELVSRGERVRLLIRKDSDVFDGIDCERAYGDVTDYTTLEAAFAGADVVYHLAGIIDVGNNNQELVWNVNVEGTKNAVAACKKCGVRRFVYASSVDAHKPLPGNKLMTEPKSFRSEELEGVYAKSKAVASQFVLDSRTDRFEPVIVLPSACIGPNDYKVSSAGAMVRLCMKGILRVSLSFGAYNFVDVRDVAAGMIGAAEKGRAGECYFLTGEVMTADEIIGLLSELCGYKAPKIKTPYWLASLAAPAAAVYSRVTGSTPLLTPLALRIIRYNCNFSNSKAQRELGYGSMPARRSFADMIGWIEENEGGARRR